MFSSISSSKALPFDSHIHNDNMRVYGDSSFSLNPKNDNFIRKLADSTRYLNHSNLIPEEGEIGVFGAEKYFGGVVDDTSNDAKKHPSQKQDKLVVVNHQSQSRLGTPSIGSESSSANSQRPLLKIGMNATITTITTNNDNNSNSPKKRTNNKRRFLSSTLRYCICYACNNKSVVDVKEDTGEISFSNTVGAKPICRGNKNLEEDQNRTTSLREKPFSFPTEPLKLVHSFQEEEVERKSLEVFGSSSMMMGKLRNKPINLEKRLAMLSCDHKNNNNIDNNNSGILFYNEDEVNSDCSSDLFEIESLTKQTNPIQSPSPSCYAPSEASVEWSVVTASALDFDERRPSTKSPVRVVQPPLSKRSVNVNKEVVVVEKQRSSSLFGCKNEKAVKVSAHDNNSVRKINAKANSNSNSHHLLRMERRKSESSMSVPVKRFEDHETRVEGISFRSQTPRLLPPPHRTLATRSLPHPYSPRLSNITFHI